MTDTPIPCEECGRMHLETQNCWRDDMDDHVARTIRGCFEAGFTADEVHDKFPHLSKEQISLASGIKPTDVTETAWDLLHRLEEELTLERLRVDGLQEELEAHLGRCIDGLIARVEALEDKKLAEATEGQKLASAIGNRSG